MKDAETGLYVRAFLLCDHVKPNGLSVDVVDLLLAVSQLKGIPIVEKKTVLIVIERNEDVAPHLMDLEWVLPDGTVRRITTSLSMPDTSGPFPIACPMIFKVWTPGTYRLRLLIDGTVAAWAPFTIEERSISLN